MKNKGINQRRFKQNPMERTFAEKWEDINTDHNGELNGVIVLDYIFAKKPGYPNGEVSARDREVAATVIQWLGSSVGQGFLRDVEEGGPD